MKTVIIGGGRGCYDILKLTRSQFLKEMDLDVQCVMDVHTTAPGMVYAKEIGIKTTTSMDEAMAMPGIELVIELTGVKSVLDEIHKTLPPSAQLIDHNFTRVFWDLIGARQKYRRQLQERSKLEEKVEQEMRYIQNIFDSIPDMVMVLDRNKTIIRTNARFAESTRIPIERALGRQCHDVLQNSPLDINCIKRNCPIDQVFKTGKPQSAVHHTQPPDETYWEVTHTPIIDNNGEISEVIETWHRITERVLLRREIEQSEQRFRQFIDSASDLICIKDMKNRYIVVNKTILDTFQKTEEEFLGKTPAEVLDPLISSQVNTHDHQVLNKGALITFEEVFPIDGKDRHFQSMRFPLPDYKGDPVGVCTISRDITQRKQLQDQLVQSAKLVAVGKLAAGVAHEINNPLTGILAFSEDIMDEMKDDDPHKEDMKVVIRETLRCRDIVKNLLDFARQDTLVLKEANMNDVVKQVLSLVVKLPKFKDIEIKEILAKKLPLVKADLRQLQQVVLNLVLNAVDAMNEKGTITLRTRYNRRLDNCEISVEDTGPGIPENLIDKVFEPFFSTKGTNGLGLALSWGIIERHHGVIEVDMAEPQGAIFRILLPALS